MLFFNPDLDLKKYVVATYWIKTRAADLEKASWELAIGQSIGNPNVRNRWETEDLFKDFSCVIMHERSKLKNVKEGYVKIGFPIVNTDWSQDGISQLLCQLMGGQMDIDTFDTCRLTNIDFPKNILKNFLGPQFGVNGIRKYTGRKDKPLCGAIIKPKIGINAEKLLSVVKELVEGGADFIKEDEIMSNPSVCPLKERVPLISNYLEKSGRKVIYAVCINADHDNLLKRAKFVSEMGANGIHVNHWSGLGAYNAIRKMNLPLYIHFQKSGDKVFTDPRHNFGIDWKVICQLAAIMGVDTIHAGMWGGYLNDDEKELKNVISLLNQHNVLPALSCGMHPGLVQAVIKQFGNDFIANVGGAIHGHPMGTKSGTKAMRQAIDKVHDNEYEQAIAKWGFVK